MASGCEQVVLATPAADVWKIVGDFGGVMDFVPGVESVRLEGRDRLVGMSGVEVRERLISLDDAAMKITYSVVDGPLESHRATLSVEPVGDGCQVSWSYDVLPDAMAPVLGRIYQAALVSLQDKLT